MRYTNVDNGYSTAALARATGGASLTVAAGDGAKFGAPTSSKPMPLAVWRPNANPNLPDAWVTNLACSGVAGDVLAIVGPLGSAADAAVQAGDKIANAPTAEHWTGIYAEIDGIALTPGPQGPQGFQGIQGPAGAAGAAGAPGSVWREGTGAPSAALGVDGDYYLDGATGDVYLRASGAYAVATNIKGAAGAPGAPGVGSFGLAMPAGFSVSNSPLAASGTITVSTTLSGVLKGTGTGLAAAAAGTDYVAPSALAGYVDTSNPQTITAVKTFASGLQANALSVGKAASGGGITGSLDATAAGVVVGMAGDMFGTVSLKLATRAGLNGILGSTNDSTADLFDFTFSTYSTAAAPLGLRLEARGSETSFGAPAFQVGSAYVGGTAASHFASAIEASPAFGCNLFGAHVVAPLASAAGMRGGSLQAQATLDLRGSLRIQTDGPSTVSQTWNAVQQFAFGFDLSAGALTATLPAGAARGRLCLAFDETGHAATNNLTIAAPAGGSIDGAASVAVAANYGSITLLALGADKFKVLSKVV